MLANTEREDNMEHILEIQKEELNKNIFVGTVSKPLSKGFSDMVYC